MIPTATDQRQPLRRLWWLHPAWLFAAVVGATMWAAVIQPDASYRLYGTPKYLTEYHVLIAAIAIVVFALGRQLAEATGCVPAPTPRAADHTIRIWFWITMGLTIFGYLVWLAVGVKNGFSLGTLWELLTTDDPLVNDSLESVFVTVKGITTCTQFGIAAVPLGLWLYFHGLRWTFWPIALVMFLATMRALLFSERLAVIELILPVLVVGLRVGVLGRSFSPLQTAGLRLAPLIGVVGLVLFFAGFEYFRSWRYYREDFDSYGTFVLWRLGGYYTTAHNNGAMALEKQSPYPIPYTTLRQFWGFPGVSSTPFDYKKLTGFDPVVRQNNMLEEHGNIELNSDGGLFQPAMDYGLGGLVLFWFGCGFVSGRMYRQFLVGTLAGLSIYPLILLAILETPRLLYLCYTRTLPGLAVLFVVIWLTSRAPDRQPIASLAPATA
jgi:hypothetical protein